MRRENYTKLIPFYTFRFVALFFSIFGIPFILRHSRDFLLKQHLYFSFCPPQESNLIRSIYESKRPQNRTAEWKIGNLTYYVMNGKQYARRTANPGKKETATG